MSIPPNVPPGGYYAAPPPKLAGMSGGWKIAGFGCLALFLLAAVGGVLLVNSFKNKLNHPTKNDVVGIAILAGKASVDGARLREAIVVYHSQHGTYPKSLMDLYTEGSIDGKLLHNDLDDSLDPAHLSWHYTQPAEGAPGSAPLLEEPYHTTLGSSIQSAKITITLDGKSGVTAEGRPPPP
jgi:hypothetical protein